ncbi:hypothetical protein, partial [Burkholderia multivorans]|uniref:hypothetical protein n=1 Tax=Burkholderia multivorans TaxID=87883 RepID=UPI001C65CEE3
KVEESGGGGKVQARARMLGMGDGGARVYRVRGGKEEFVSDGRRRPRLSIRCDLVTSLAATARRERADIVNAVDLQRPRQTSRLSRHGEIKLRFF